MLDPGGALEVKIVGGYETPRRRLQLWDASLSVADAQRKIDASAHAADYQNLLHAFGRSIDTLATSWAPLRLFGQGVGVRKDLENFSVFVLTLFNGWDYPRPPFRRDSERETTERVLVARGPAEGHSRACSRRPARSRTRRRKSEWDA